MDEKMLPQPRKFDPVGFSLTGIRVWQWSSSFIVWASFGVLYDHIRQNGLGENKRMKGVQLLVRVHLFLLLLFSCSLFSPSLVPGPEAHHAFWVSYSSHPCSY